MAKFSCGETVLNVNTKQNGVICEVRPKSRSRQFYRVRFDDSVETCMEQDLVGVFDIDNPFERIKKGIYGTRDQFVLVNTTYKINNSNNNTISSLKASKTIFKGYQFKPLLKFLNSPSRRILIADEVGLGKTIEAGHIIHELKARNEFKSALIVCPNSLRIKWRTELQEKFGVSFKLYESLNDAAEDLRAHPQTARGILNYEKIRAKKQEEEVDDKDKKEASNILIDFLEEGLQRYSLVLCDEAHKLKNDETQTYKGMAKILNNADAVVFLTATPIMLGENDLYNLLRLLEPDNFDNKEVFQNLINANKPFVRAISMLNANEPFAHIKEVLVSGSIEKRHKFGDSVFSSFTTVEKEFKDIPLYDKIIGMLSEEDNLAVRSLLQNYLAEMSTINHIFSRTRKREVSTDERQQTERNAHKITVYLTHEERELYDEVIDEYIESVGGEKDETGKEKVPWGAKLGLIAKKRMVASSVNAYRLWVDNNGDVDSFSDDLLFSYTLPDAKINELTKIFQGVKEAGGTKIIIFLMYKFTIRYLANRLNKLGYKVFSIHGDIKDRETIIEEFRNCEEFCVLLSSEVGSEGLDMQFCSHLVNYDLPWNPMVVEQRIGRIDRFGQKAAQVQIYNLVVHDSIQELIYDRLLTRIGVFQGVIGDLEMILEEMGEEFKKLENDLYGMKLSKAAQEKKIRDLAKACENEKIQLKEVEEGMTNALSNDVYFQNEINKIRHNRLYVTEEELKNYVKMLIGEKLTTCSFKRMNEDEYGFAVPKSTPKVLINFLMENQPSGADFDDLFRTYRQDLLDDFMENSQRILTFNQQYAFEHKFVDYVNIYNPIIVASSKYFKDSITEIGKTFQLIYKLPDEVDLPMGMYYLAVYCVSSNRKIKDKDVVSDTLVPVLYDVKNDITIKDEEINMKIFGEIQENGEFFEVDFHDDMTLENFDDMEGDFAEYISDFVNRKQQENVVIDTSKKELRIRQLKQFHDPRVDKAKKDVKQESDMVDEIIYRKGVDGNDVMRAKNRLQLAKNRLKLAEAARDNAMDYVNSIQSPTLSYKLISLTKVIMY